MNPCQNDLLLTAWAAGFIDGEGTIFIGRNRAPNGAYRYFLTVSASQTGATEPECLRRLQGLFGGRISVHKPYRKSGHRAPGWRWEAHSRQAIYVLETLLPFLTVKREQARVAIEYRRNAVGRGKGELAAAYRDKLKALRRVERVMTTKPAYPRRGQPKKLSDENVIEVRRRYAAGGVTMKELANAYSVSEALIRLIVRNLVRVHLQPV